ncbi:glycine dehydrogenase (aminomethyl-transferring) [Candidatus Desantisbacteria bacterium CG1_02_38_46]|uniref:Probable glycine dehydrogenase (decarboxylating) subunit 1 n=3 Tax=unclassified Candidatus Desantisiibacteriota TaxID=3106372 RepID=A0A2H9PCY1_9BACT|nr:MAG: glycine dehydrogenase (aminomethyl-transferring) [Candidatus Desantisbacteria bacterium CG1_02_38_46]PIU52198.1 MAG: aminomethyl-transferring glycine dehydrogenase [Candidatus Desantisbacteria bacterium CG07_land_8_20_14_0_80_39_15]PIZ17195.1 MAG: aminomethyl-transferring glycine dehydrogenase [Candidatus Desantisbacteria bacterium CG_4_10_14_0_8_um_filter_39_17]
MTYIPNTDEDRKKMLQELELSSIDELFKNIPEGLRCKGLDIPEGKSELELRKYFSILAKKNSTGLACFLGGGFYDHFIPAALEEIVSRAEFYTPYTPYQPEISQGILQSMFEYQTAICNLTGMEVSNASLYDGGTALYEAMMMAIRITGRKKVVVCGGVNLIYKTMLYSYTKNLYLKMVEIPISEQGTVSRMEIKKELNEEVACVILQNPNFFGCMDDFTDISEIAHQKGILVVVSVYPISLGFLKTPGEMNADIATGEGQSLGIPLSFGGPYLGFMTTLMKYVRKMPGRIVGETTDRNGTRGYVLTLQAREQHIRRESATSNICSNEAWCALRAVIYLSLLGKEGLKEVANLCYKKANYMLNRLLQIPKVERKFSSPVFNEFVLKLPKNSGEIINALIEKGFVCGFPLERYYKDMDNCILVAVTEKRTKEEIGMLAEAIEAVI